jgi:hypothetical protein
MSDPIYTIRAYAAADFELLTEWWLAHDGQRRPATILPKCGVVCSINDKPAAALFLHMDNSCGMCMVEHAVSRPGLSLKKARAAFGHCVAVLKKIAGVHGYHTMAAFVPAAIARTLENVGFMRAEENLVQMVGFIEPEVSHG